MPFAGYENFNACVKDQLNKHKGQEGFKIENAKSICGALQARTEKKNIEMEESHPKDACGIINYEEVETNE